VAHNCENGDTMVNRCRRRLVREGEPSQTTDKGLEIPVPKRDEFFDALDKASKKNSDQEKASPDPVQESHKQTSLVSSVVVTEYVLVQVRLKVLG
jgi:hypothetical protein